jgi:predicted peptidase
MMRTAMLCLVLWMGLMSMVRAEGDPQPGQQVAQQLRTQVEVQLGYLLYLPKDYATQEAWPLLLFLHGAGERGDDLELVKKHGPPKRIAAGTHFPFIVVSPQCPRGRWWEPQELLALLDEVGRKYKVDADRVYVSGLSMGGFGTWRLASVAPERFAAIAPICGGGEKSWARQIVQLPVWAFHGARDTVVPVQRSQEMVDELQRLGGNVRLTVYAEAGHDSWTETYNNPDFYQWLLEQRRRKTQ